jgi:hypothetical protein
MNLPGYKDPLGWTCASWAGYNCSTATFGQYRYTTTELHELQINCCCTCDTCTPPGIGPGNAAWIPPPIYHKKHDKKQGSEQRSKQSSKQGILTASLEQTLDVLEKTVHAGGK